jgi:hypothetical protein
MPSTSSVVSVVPEGAGSVVAEFMAGIFRLPTMVRSTGDDRLPGRQNGLADAGLYLPTVERPTVASSI